MGRQSADKAPQISKVNILYTGLRLLDEVGLEQLSLRRIADELGVQTPALYWHIRDRDELYGLMAEAMLRESLDRIPADLEGADFLLALGRSLHATHRARRDAARLIALAKPRGDLTEALTERVERGGISRAAEAVAAVYSFTLGWSLFRANPWIDAAMAKRMHVEHAFERGLAVIAGGFGTAS
jgi:TetR/AcrR family tetracycline transcriptional repressor